MKKIPFTGSGVALITPFNENGVNFKLLEELIEYHIKEGTDAIIICGTTGESSTMTSDEHKETIRFTVEKTNKRIPVIAGTGSNNTAHAIEMSKYAESVGADGVLVVTPYYNKTTQKGLVEHYTTIANSISIPVIAYNVPSRTGLNITAATAKKLSKVENIVAIKEASGNFSQIAEIAATCGDDLYLYSGNDDQVVPMLSLGAKGVISVSANIIPSDTHKMVMSYIEGDINTAKELQLKAIDLINALFIEVNPIPVKAAMELKGYNVGKCRLPLTTMSEANLEILKKAIENY